MTVDFNTPRPELIYATGETPALKMQQIEAERRHD
jgi:hypothetical protein